MSSFSRLSVPELRRRPPRPVTEDELSGLLAAADVLIPGAADLPSASNAPDIRHWLEVALAARREAFDEVLRHAVMLGRLDPAARLDELRRLRREDPDAFEPLASVLAGAYLMVPEVREAIGYPGQERSFPPFDLAAEELRSGILDPVIARGTIAQTGL